MRRKRRRTVRPSGGKAAWRERFVLNLPPALAEQLLSPAPGDNPYAGTALELTLSLVDGAAAGGLGEAWGSAAVPVLYSWLGTQVDLLRSNRQVAAGAAGSAEAGGEFTVELQPSAAAAAHRSAASGEPPAGSLRIRLSLDAGFVEEAALSQPGGGGARPWGGAGRQSPGARAAPPEAGRALRLEGTEAWVPFSYSNMQRLAPGSQLSGRSVVPICAGAGLALETSFEARALTAVSFIHPHAFPAPLPPPCALALSRPRALPLPPLRSH
jgi:vacuolar protein sorting-associated protein 13A/C